MDAAFPGESAAYRAARNRLLEQEIGLRRAMEAVAAARRRLPPGGVVPQDYVFQTQSPPGGTAEMRLSELFAPGKDSLVIYSMMFPRASDDDSPARAAGRPPCYRWRRARARRAPRSSISWMARPSTPPSGSTSRSPPRRRSSACSPSALNAAGGGCACCRRPGPATTVTTWPRPQTASNGQCCTSLTASVTPSVTSGLRTVVRAHRPRAGTPPCRHARTAVEPVRPHPGGTAGRLVRAAELLTTTGRAACHHESQPFFPLRSDRLSRRRGGGLAGIDSPWGTNDLFRVREM